jgi:serine/threonine protein kinase
MSASAASAASASVAASSSASSSSKCVDWIPVEGGEILGDWTPEYMDIFLDILENESSRYKRVVQMMGCITGCFREAKRARITENLGEERHSPKKLGAGGFGDVYDLQNGSVMKIIKDSRFPKREATFLYSLTSGVFPKFIAAYSGQNREAHYDIIIMERIPGISLQSFTIPESEEAPSTPLEKLSDNAKIIFLNTLRDKLKIAINELHNKDKVAHCDIKPANIVVDVNLTTGSVNSLKLVDGGSLDTFGNELSLSRAPGTGGYCAMIDSEERISFSGWVPQIRPARPFAIRFIKEKFNKTANGKAFRVSGAINEYSFHIIDQLIIDLKKHFRLYGIQNHAKNPASSFRTLNELGAQGGPLPPSPFLSSILEENNAASAAPAPPSRRISRKVSATAAPASASASASASAASSASAAPPKAPPSRRISRKVSATAAPALELASASAAPHKASPSRRTSRKVSPTAAPALAPVSASAAPATSGSKRSRSVRGGRRTRRKRRSRTRKVRFLTVVPN